jgi:quinol monooxygenase YgiN
VEAFRDDDAGAAHVQSEHFKVATKELPNYLAETPRIVNAQVPGTDWSELGEMAVDKG